MNADRGGSAEALNEFQQRHLRVSCQYVDKLLSEIESILNSSVSKSAFPRYISQVSPASRRTIEDYIARIRAQLVRILDAQHIQREKPDIPDVRAISVNLGAIDIAVDELKPKDMRGYGEVPEPVALDLNGIVGELHGLVSRLTRYVSEGQGQDLRARLQRLEHTSNEFDLLNRIEGVVTKRGLVEFRSPIAAIVDRIEDRSFEIAVFGRVSSGKSSLLNGILASDILPVGVTPITAVPTRIRYALSRSITVWFAEHPPQTYEAGQLAEFATEQRNPGNTKHVMRIVLSLPAERLREGVTFVDTPGLGSLATSGAAETLAYLPRCDLGVVLIDGGTTLAPEDLRTIEMLQEAAIPVHVLLSKADLLAPSDRERMIVYVKEHISAECRLDLPVHPMSAMTSHRAMLDEWFQAEILPLYVRAQELKAASLRRKIGGLRESVVAALKVSVRREHGESAHDEKRLRDVEARLRQATGKIEELRMTVDRELDVLPYAGRQILDYVAAQMTSASGARPASSDTAVRGVVVNAVHDLTSSFHKRLHELAVSCATELRTVSGELGLSNKPAENEFEALVRAEPIFDLSEAIEVAPSKIDSLFGARFATKRMAQHLTEKIGPALDRSLATYGGLLRSWVTSVLNQLKRAFDDYADSYRAHVERNLATGNLATGEVEGVVEDLKLLGEGAVAFA
ncbi:MAG TPA: dynamin family protein [Candidatus Acidoferrales bacterium]|nr:dynamin family protein [Candidatus Acidoferrales bacterium]